MNIRMRILAGSFLALTLAVLAILHILWGSGIPFPAESFDELGGAVVPSGVWPSPMLTFLVAAALCGASVAVVLRMFDLARPRSILTPWLIFASYALAVVFALRSILGFLISSGLWGIDPADATFHRWDLLAYSPLCLLLALCALALVRQRDSNANAALDSRT
ncbi:DUF3995 domain-containing protein [Salinibacterium sp. UTAS2018]|uniref:DUF3995 domain-containing protein n=1 Tax=Salinibacterium sp. UTAS2018 TaxID=2508880 RepID=UPI0010094A53|nr:DUF3995 domain-containing protein [Salinibacterium sp. UTAS2018]QAV68962.1 DUF3995 domain-containing protein [Salinibacterium sp. UTAS2018]